MKIRFLFINYIFLRNLRNLTIINIYNVLISFYSTVPSLKDLNLSEEPFILDRGFVEKNITYLPLLNFLNNNQKLIQVNWIKNIGSYRKLIPVLEEKWNEDCFIITIDDDTIYDKYLIENLINDFNQYKCVIGYTLNMNVLQDFNYLNRKEKDNLYKYNILTGKGGILYKPQFFHKTKDLIFNQNIFLEVCPKHDDIWFYILRIMNGVNCFFGEKNWMIRDISSEGLYIYFNLLIQSHFTKHSQNYKHWDINFNFEIQEIMN